MNHVYRCRTCFAFGCEFIAGYNTVRWVGKLIIAAIRQVYRVAVCVYAFGRQGYGWVRCKAAVIGADNCFVKFTCCLRCWNNHKRVRNGTVAAVYRAVKNLKFVTSGRGAAVSCRAAAVKFKCYDATHRNHYVSLFFKRKTCRVWRLQTVRNHHNNFSVGGYTYGWTRVFFWKRWVLGNAAGNCRVIRNILAVFYNYIMTADCFLKRIFIFRVVSGVTYHGCAVFFDCKERPFVAAAFSLGVGCGNIIASHNKRAHGLAVCHVVIRCVFGGNNTVVFAFVICFCGCNLFF